jgi:hypothetical protein
LLLDAAVTSSGVAVATGTFGVFVQSAKDAPYVTASDLSGTCQSANTYGADNEYIALTGTFVTSTSGRPSSVAGVATSTDKGASFTVSPIPAVYPRYGAFPSEQTWYVSSGTWGEDPAVAAKFDSSKYHRLSSRLAVAKDGSEGFHLLTDEVKKPAFSAKNATNAETGWYGKVSKTTDGGKTWTEGE